MKNKPTKIYLQLGLEENGEHCNDFNELSGVSWCADKIYDDDLEFVSLDFLAEIDDKLALMEDEAHGEWGDLITKLRGKINKAWKQ